MRSKRVDRFKFGEIEVHFGPDVGDMPSSIAEPSSAERRATIADLLKAENDDAESDLLWSTT
jgi:hypothetical protein